MLIHDFYNGEGRNPIFTEDRKCPSPQIFRQENSWRGVGVRRSKKAATPHIKIHPLAVILSAAKDLYASQHPVNDPPNVPSLNSKPQLIRIAGTNPNPGINRRRLRRVKMGGTINPTLSRFSGATNCRHLRRKNKTEHRFEKPSTINNNSTMYFSLLVFHFSLPARHFVKIH
ncbi:MAG: hypothetical protein KA293_02610 [Bacteroidia bacterium]|nr:hypothetical protein [Bacteroidia bacterium]